MGNRFTGGPYPRGCPQLRVPATREQLAELAARAARAGLSVAVYARGILWPERAEGSEKAHSVATK